MGCCKPMIENWLFILAIIAVLMIPGPGNALVASSAHQLGKARTSLLIPAILAGYLYAINAWALLIHLLSPTWPNFQACVHILSSIYVGWMTFRLYKIHQLEKHSKAHPSIRPWEMFFTTLKNPKAALIAAGILPSNTWDQPYNFILIFSIFSILVLPVFAFWMVYGQTLLSNQSGKIKADLLYKGSALFLLICLIPLILHFD